MIIQSIPKCTSRFGLHKWGKWTVPVKAVSSIGLVQAMNGSEPVAIQSRICFTCGVIEQRELIATETEEASD